MMVAVHSMDWVKALRVTKLAGICVLSFAAGGWFNSIGQHTGQLPYLKRVANEHETEERVLGSNPIATVNCERHKSDVATGVAVQAVVSNYAANVPIPSLSTIPNCPAPRSAR